jgi:hypothetical protein
LPTALSPGGSPYPLFDFVDYSLLDLLPGFWVWILEAKNVYFSRCPKSNNPFLDFKNMHRVSNNIYGNVKLKQSRSSDCAKARKIKTYSILKIREKHAIHPTVELDIGYQSLGTSLSTAGLSTAII